MEIKIENILSIFGFLHINGGKMFDSLINFVTYDSYIQKMEECETKGDRNTVRKP